MTMCERFGLRRFPVVTAVVCAVTGASNVLQSLVPGMLARLERAPAGLHGEWWRTGTALFVQDGGVVAGVLARVAADRGVPVVRRAAAGALLTGAAMTAAGNIHGAALLAGIAIAACAPVARTDATASAAPHAPAGVR